MIDYEAEPTACGDYVGDMPVLAVRIKDGRIVAYKEGDGEWVDLVEGE